MFGLDLRFRLNLFEGTQFDLKPEHMQSNTLSQKFKNFKRLKAKLIVISSIYGKCCCEQIWKTSVLRRTLNTTNSTDGTNFAKWDSTMTLIPTVSTFKKSTRPKDMNICEICKIKRTKCGRFVTLVIF